jgi:hypothetical protein
MDRRKFMQATALTGAGAAISGSTRDFPAILKKGAQEYLQVGVIGVGARGSYLMRELMRRDDCNVVAICDIDENAITKCKRIAADLGEPEPQIYGYSHDSYLELIEDTQVDAVVIATPWRWHSIMACAAMHAGKYTATEVGGALSVEECWELVRTHEDTGTHLMFLENVCYRRDVMAVLQMVRQNLFGELIHLECGYQHDLREVKFNNGKQIYGGGVEFGERGLSEARWRTDHSVHRNGDLYPTHGIGPVANYIDINRGNRFVSLVSMASKSRSLHEYIVNHPHGGPHHPNASIDFKLGDKVSTMIRCNNGETVVIHHDTNMPRPYSLGFRVQGTRGLWMAVNRSLMIEGMTPAHRWTEARPFLEKYDHPLWKKYGPEATGAGHGGMDWFVLNAFVESAKRNVAPPLDVYDAATWMAITPLSEQSIAAGSAPMSFPDFTRGRWMHRRNNFALGDTW